QRPPCWTLLPYTTLFRSRGQHYRRRAPGFTTGCPPPFRGARGRTLGALRRIRALRPPDMAATLRHTRAAQCLAVRGRRPMTSRPPPRPPAGARPGPLVCARAAGRYTGRHDQLPALSWSAGKSGRHTIRAAHRPEEPPVTPPHTPSPRKAFGRLSLPERTYITDALRTETVGGVLLLLAAVAALVWANIPALGDSYTS